MVLSASPAQHPALTSAERFVVTCSAYDWCPESTLRERLAALRSEDWPTVFRLTDEHQLASHLWYHVERVREELVRDVAGPCAGRYYESLKWDLCYTVPLQAVSDAFTRAKLPVALVKGICWQQWLYRDRPLPRGSGDLDVLVFGEEASVVALVESLGWTCQGWLFLEQGRPIVTHVPWHEAWRQSSELLFERPGPGGRTLRLELHRAPAMFHYLGARRARRLTAWLAAQRRPIPWRSDGSPGSVSVPSFSPTGTLVYQTVHLFKEGSPALRSLNDLARIIEQFGSALEWEEAWTIAEQSGIARALGWGLALTQVWRGVNLPAAVARRAQAGGSRLTAPAVLWGRTDAVRGWRGLLSGRWAWAFGWRAYVRTWLTHEWRRCLVLAPRRADKVRYLVRQPVEWAVRLVGG